MTPSQNISAISALSAVKSDLYDPSQLTLHPALVGLLRWSMDDPSLADLAADLSAHGQIQDVIVTPSTPSTLNPQPSTLLVVDGWERVKAAKLKGLKVRARTVSFANDLAVVSFALRTTNLRKHLTAGQIAFTFYPALRESHELLVRAHSAALASGNAALNPTLAAAADKVSGKPLRNLNEVAQSIGVSCDSFSRAATVWSYFRGDWPNRADGRPDAKFEISAEVLAKVGLRKGRKYTLEEVFRPQIERFHKPAGLGACIAGIEFLIQTQYPVPGRKRHAGAPPKELQRQLELFTDSFTTLSKRWSYWQNFDAPSRDAAITAARESFREMPYDLLQSLGAALRAERDRRAKANET